MSHHWGDSSVNPIRHGSSIRWGPDSCPVCKDLGSQAPRKDLRNAALAVDFLRLLRHKKKCKFCALLYTGLKLMLQDGSSMSDISGLQLLMSFGKPITASVVRIAKKESYVDQYFELYTPLGVEPAWPSLGASREISSDPVGGDNIDLVISWLRTCIDDHESCPSTVMPTPLPTRVVDIGSLVGVQSPDSLKLYETNREPGIYVTLSHCWGSSGQSETKSYKTESGTLKSRLEGIDWDSLPKTYQDAIYLANKLQIQYIWIDSLCIIQDDRDDWERESAVMGSIYENAFLTIGASSAPHSEAGFLRPRSQYHPHEIPFKRDDNKEEPHAIRVCELVARSIEPDDPLRGRAWAYQERLLSPRFLSFNSDQIRWYCRSRIYYESFQAPDVLPRADGGEERDLFKWWRNEIVKEYSQRRLTFESDMLPAVSGIAMQIQAKTGDTYLAGLWRKDLPRGLMWSCWPQRPSTPSKTFRAPSWSWASVKNSVTFAGDEYEPLVRVVDAQCTLLGAKNNPCGQVVDGHIILYGLVITSVLEISVFSPGGNESILSYSLAALIELTDTKPVFSPDVPLSEGSGLSFGGETQATVERSILEPNRPRPAVSSQVWCLLLARRGPKKSSESVGWILMLLGRSSKVNGAFVRLGLVEVQVGTDLAEGVTPTEIVIV